MKQNLNNTSNLYYDTNFESAYALTQQKFTHNEYINMLKYGNIAEKQFSAINLDCINDNNDLTILLSNLTGCDGKIREAVAFKINTLLNINPNLKELFSKNSADIFAQATIDINANICRLIVDSAAILKDYSYFSHKYSLNLINYIKEALVQMHSFVFKDKKYVINKQLFKIYWCLEAFAIFYDCINEYDLENVLSECLLLNEYTISEKIAQIIVSSNKFNNIKKIITNDSNYYVQHILKSSRHP